MKQIIDTISEKCQGCTSCIRICPVKEANIAYINADKIKVRVDPNTCIACGACLEACRHNARFYNDDTERFFDDIRSGEPIALIVAPAFRENFENWRSILAWLKTEGASKIVDVSLGIEICIWAHIRYIEQNHPLSLITQPCPPIVGYIARYNAELLKGLSPVHSPILCSSIYIKKVIELPEKIAALTPCPAKTNEFIETNIVSYNVTFKKLAEHLKINSIRIPQANFKFDNIAISTGRDYSMATGLAEDIKRYLGNKISVQKSEGQDNVYRHLDSILSKVPLNVPILIDMLNCPEGCNFGAGCNIAKSIFKNKQITNEQHEEERHCDINDAEQANLFSFFDKNLDLSAFISCRREFLPGSR